ncbi:PTS glucitol/sorbitol transporter subunit IIA [Pseudalkalibacillus hwajinpoensis]|uniref:PTS glucitol/sorbitol transporter subunit IIA n=1 Tax=Guptibacillus hwajinpoensis TaxID=208199 RepID=UPI00325B8FE4
MEVIYQTKVNKLGPLVEEFYDEKMMILFKEDAPAELAEYCILHSENNLNGEIKKGDTLQIDHHNYRITAVGSAVNKNLSTLGHITLKFNGEEEPDLPGTLVLEEKEMNHVQVGNVIKISRD